MAKKAEPTLCEGWEPSSRSWINSESLKGMFKELRGQPAATKRGQHPHVDDAPRGIRRFFWVNAIRSLWFRPAVPSAQLPPLDHDQANSPRFAR
jgi:hypothetical protein